MTKGLCVTKVVIFSGDTKELKITTDDTTDDDDELSDETLPEDGRDLCDRVVRNTVRVDLIKFMPDSLGED